MFSFLYFHAPDNAGLYRAFNLYFVQADGLKMKRPGFELDSLAPFGGKVPRLGEFVFPLSPCGQDEKGLGLGWGWHLCSLHSMGAFCLGQTVSSLLPASARSYLEVGVGEAPQAWANTGEFS